MNQSKIVCVSGYFDPIHVGHIEYFKSAKQLGDELCVAINSDDWLIRKKGQAFMNFRERANIIENLSMVDHVISFDDADDNTISASEINDFVWKGMNTVYLYKSNTPDLANDRFSSTEEYADYLNSYSTPENLFESLIVISFEIT